MKEATEKDVIYLQQSYVNSHGVIIHALIPERAGDGVDPEPQKFMAMGQHHIALQGMPQPVPIQFQFQIPGVTIAEAFANFAVAFEKGKKEAEIQARAEHRRRVISNLQ